MGEPKAPMTLPDAVLVIGAGMLQVPLMQSIQGLGFQVIATDANPEAPGAAIADVFCVADTYDASATAALLPALHARSTVRGVVTGGLDCAPTVSLCAERAGVPGLPYATACLTHDKALVRNRLDAEGLAHYQPRWMLAYGERSNRLHLDTISRGALGGWPIVIKPLEQRASRGVTLLHTPEAFPAAVARALAYGDEYLIEECLVGTEHSAEMILDHGRVLFWNVVDRFFDYRSGTGIEVGHVNPSSLLVPHLAAIRDMVAAAAEALGVTWGPFKADVMFTTTGPKILEVTARLSGGWDSQWTSPATGRHPMRLLVQLACGLPVEVPGSPQGAAACAAILPQKAGIVTAVPMRYTGVDLVWTIEPGTRITPATHNGMRAGYVLAHAPTAQEAWCTVHRAAQRIAAVVEAKTEGDENA